jgi:hypothetical protein
MLLLSNLIDKCVGNDFEINCSDIELHGFEDNAPPFFKGPGIITGEISGQFSFKVFNEIPLSEYNSKFLKQIELKDDPKSFNVRLFAKDYEGFEWTGGWSVPKINWLSMKNFQNFLVYGNFQQLSTRIVKTEGDKEKDTTELIYAGCLELPYSKNLYEKKYHGRNIESYKIWKDHESFTFKKSIFLFQENENHSRTHIKIKHSEQFTPPP